MNRDDSSRVPDDSEKGNVRDFGTESLGTKLRERRLAKGLSIAELAKMTGFTPSFISQLERGVTSISIQSLRLICRALNVPVFHLFIDEDTRRTVIRAGERRILSLPNSNVEYELISSQHSDARMEMLLMRLEPGDSNFRELFSHEGEEIVFVLRGEMRIDFENDSEVLRRGDSIYFDSRIPHRYTNVGSGTLEAIIATTPPSY